MRSITYKILQHNSTNKYRVMTYTPFTPTMQQFSNIYKGDDGHDYIMQWLQHNQTSSTILEFPTVEAAQVAIDDLNPKYDLTNYVEISDLNAPSQHPQNRRAGDVTEILLTEEETLAIIDIGPPSNEDGDGDEDGDKDTQQ